MPKKKTYCFDVGGVVLMKYGCKTKVGEPFLIFHVEEWTKPWNPFLMLLLPLP